MNASSSTEIQKFSSDILWVAISQAILSLTSIIILPFLTKYYSSEIYGIWTQIFVTVGVLSPILSLQFGTAMVRFLAAEEDREKRRRAFGAMLWSVLALACLMLVIAQLLRQDLSTLLFANPEYVYFIPLIFLWASMEALFSLTLSYLRARGKIKRLSVIQLGLAIVKIAVIVSLAMARYSLSSIIIYLVIGEAVFVATAFGMITKEIGFPKADFRGLKNYLAFSIPQIPGGLLLWIINFSDRYFITYLVSLSHTGIYSASYTLGSVLSLFFTPIGTVLLPTVSKSWEQKELPRVKSYFEYSTKLFLTLAIPGAAGLYILSQPLLGILSTSEYMVGGSLVLLVALGTIFYGLYNLNVYIIYLVQQTKWLLLMVGVAAVTNAGINLALIPKIGIMGAAISTIVSYFVLAAIVTVWARKTINYKMDFKFLGKVIAATIVMAFCLRFIPTDNIWYVMLAIIAGAAIFALGLFLLKAFSTQDRRLIKEALAGLNPKLWRKG